MEKNEKPKMEETAAGSADSAGEMVPPGTINLGPLAQELGFARISELLNRAQAKNIAAENEDLKGQLKRALDENMELKKEFQKNKNA